jgi:glycosyltransferase involved in cell wall biosynthesis
MTEVHQVLVSASPGDAVTTSALVARDTLRASGVDGEIYARFFDPRVADDVRPLGSMPADTADVLVYHASIGEPEVFEFLHHRDERLALAYHNISPAGAFAPYDPKFARLLEGGRRELAALARRVTVAFADSRFNAAELHDLGYADVRVAPLVVDTDRLLAVEPDPDTSHHLATQMEGPVILFVGQLLPHKRPDFLIGAFHALVTWLLPEAHLVLAGVGRLPEYRDALQHLISELNLAGAWLTGELTDSELAAFFRRADLFVTASEHEGFCAPLLEAMAFEVPVIARDFAAIPETLGDGGLLLPADAGFALAAEAMNTVLTEDSLRAALVQRAQRRIVEMVASRPGTTLADQLLTLVAA